ncbi:hypothetical protein P9112_012313 [Eukaryota sp. TZLM1-RC]
MSFTDTLLDAAHNLNVTVPSYILSQIESSQDILDLSTITLRPFLLHAIGAALATSPHFSGVSLADCYCDDNTLAHFIELIHTNTSLTQLNLRGNNLGQAACDALAELLRKTTSLEYLSLEWNKLGQYVSNLSRICDGLAQNHSLTNLDLRNNYIKEDGAAQISKVLSVNKSLTSLDLRFNNIGDQGAKSILSVLEFENKAITTVSLGVNSISVELLDQIQTLVDRNASLLTSEDHYLADSQFKEIESEVFHTQGSSKLMSRLKVTQSDNERLAEVNQNLNEKVNNLLQENGGLSRRAISAEERAERLEGQVDELSTEVKDLSEQLLDLRASQKESLDGFIKGQKNYEKQIFELRSRIVELTDEKGSLESELEMVKNEVDVQKQGRSKESERFSAEKGQLIRHHKAEIAELKQEFNDKVEGLITKQKTLEDLRIQAEEALNSCKADLEKEKSRHSQSVVEMQNRLEQEHDFKLRLETKKVTDLTEEVNDLRQSLSSLQKKLNLREAELGDELSRERSKRNDCERRTAKMEGDFDSLKVSLTSLQSELDDNKRNIEDYKLQLQSLKHQLDDKRKDYDLLATQKRDELREKDTIITELNNEVERLKKENMEKSQQFTQRLSLLENSLISNVRNAFRSEI